MSVVVDTGVLYAHHDRDAPRNAVAKRAMDSLLEGSLGRPLVSEYIHDEVVTLTLGRTSSHRMAVRLSDRILGRGEFPEVFRMLWIDEPLFERSRAVFEEFADQRLSFTDATTVALVEHHAIDHVLSFDDDFDGLVDRVDPAEL